MTLELAEREKSEDILFLDTAQQYKGHHDAMRVIQCVMNHFKFGYAGYNGYFTHRQELFDEIEKLLKEERL